MPTEQEIRNWLNSSSAGSGVYGRDWNGLCQAFVWRFCEKFGTAPVTYPTAKAAYEASSIVNGTSLNGIKNGDVGYWRLGSDGHVAIWFNNGWIMGSSKVSSFWAKNAGWVSHADYQARAGLPFLGFSRTNGRNTTGSWGNDSSAPQGSTAPASSGLNRFGKVHKEILQRVASLFGYEGPIDGDPQGRTIECLQTGMIFEKHLPETYSVDKIWGPNLEKGLQRFAAKEGGYTGPIDGDLSFKSFEALQTAYDKRKAPKPTPAPAAPANGGLNRFGKVHKEILQRVASLFGYEGPIDGEPAERTIECLQAGMLSEKHLPATYGIDKIWGPNLESALQRFAAKEGGYAGPIDGDLSFKSFEALQTAYDKRKAPKPTPATPPVVVVVPPATTPVSEKPKNLPEGENFGRGIDINSWQPNGNIERYAKYSGQEYLLVKWDGGNTSDAYYVAPNAPAQLAAGRAQNLKIGQYTFNGKKNGLTPTTLAEHWLKSNDLREGEVKGFDVEHETVTDTKAYTPEETWEYCERINRETGLIQPIYMNMETLRNGGDWTQVASKYPLWIAKPSDSGDFEVDLNGDFGPWKPGNIFAIQYTWTNKYKVAGFEEYPHLDQNVIFKDVWDRVAFRKVTRPEAPVEPVVTAEQKLQKLIEGLKALLEEFEK